ncbi:MAG TPA: GAF domain-containing protein [Acetobacteraceae bacterium]|nr:GAF domain-containing protein [Acetobacteraceae bacterium]
MLKSHAPEFGEADLSNCEREKINVPGSIQPHGVMLVVEEPGLRIVQASANAGRLLALPEDVIGQDLARLSPSLVAGLRPLLAGTLHEYPMPVRCTVGSGKAQFDALVHRPSAGGGLVVELEPAGPCTDPAMALAPALEEVVSALTLRALCDEAARAFKRITGYDRVMVYRFDDAGHGEVLAEQREPGLEPYLGNRYPASDIPQIARRLYERNRIRVLVDVDYMPSPLVPPLSPLTDAPLDMSLCGLRSMSPIHIQYLKNMGVGATLVISLMVGGRLWGLVACHHYVPRQVPYEVRTLCELIAEAIATRIAALESFVQGQAEISVRRLEQRMIDATGRDGDWRAGLFDGTHAVLQPVNATGAALLFDGQIVTAGEVPATPELREIGAWLDAQPRAPVIATASLGIDAPQFGGLRNIASGLIATAASASSGEYLIWFRPERIRTVTWGGNPFKPVAVGNDPADLSPRRSFSQWHQLVEGTSEPWSSTDLAAARLIGESITDVALQFRALRMLVAQDQLASVVNQVAAAEQPTVIADAAGKLLLCNEAFHRLLPAGPARPTHIHELAAAFSDDRRAAQRLEELLVERKAWRGEVFVGHADAAPVTLLVRADPVFATPDRVLGFVLLFTDVSERKSAERARRRFYDSMVARRPLPPEKLDADSSVKLQSLLSTVVANAQLAALEIADGRPPADLPALLESVQASVSRVADMLTHLLWHARSNIGGPQD